MIPVLFYTYNGAFGKSPDWVNITIFFVAAAIAFWLEFRLFRKPYLPCRYPWAAVYTVCIIAVLFVIFTFAPIRIPSFQDPLTGTYGR